ncbi:MAG: Ig domain-containing protein [Prevotella sp.]|nr:Ig domain-containing protein [Prevotella sp.]
MKQKLFSILALLLMAATGAWAQTETLLTTITPTGKDTYSETTAGVVTVTPSNMRRHNADYGWLWSQSGSVTVEAKEGYTITKCVFKQNSKTPVTITTSPFAITFNGRGNCVQNDDMDGVTSIEVYGPAAPVTTYSITLAEGTEDADQWTIEPKTGLKGGETVTATYKGEKKVKSVKAVKKAAAAVTTPLDNTTTAWTAGTFAVPAGGLTYSDAITVSGDVTLTLTDGETLTLNKGISLTSGATLTIQGKGAMVVNGTSNSTASTVAGSTGTLILTSGTLTATGGKGQDVTENDQTGASGGAAINGSVTVNGGSLTVKGGNGGNCSAPTIGPDTYGGAGGAAISGDVTITDGAVAATGGNGGSIGASNYGLDLHGGAGGAAIGGNATLTGGTLTTTQGANGTETGRLSSSSVGAGGKAVAGTVTNNGGQLSVKVTSITLNKTATEIKVGSTETLSVTAVAPDNATDKTYTWKTSDASKATVDQDGKVTAVAAGTVTIYAEANDGSGVKGSCTVTVTPATITVTWNKDDITGSGKSFTKDGVTITMTRRTIDFTEKNFTAGGEFTTTLGNFTKIEVTASRCSASGTGWSGDSAKKTWTGNASSVSFNNNFEGRGGDIEVNPKVWTVKQSKL